MKFKINAIKKKNYLINFERDIFSLYEKGKIKAPIHLSGNNELQLIEIFKKIKKSDWVISNWRNHYHALLHGIPEDYLKNKIISGKSMSINSYKYKFYSSSIVAGGLPIGLGIALALKRKKLKSKVWIFIGDMTFETGIFHEVYKYSVNFNLPVTFVIEDNGMSTNTPTKKTWGIKNNNKPKGKKIIYYKYNRKYPHHGIGKWVLF
jgi:pyruvate dehydrogenase E1 component alpha subunit